LSTYLVSSICDINDINIPFADGFTPMLWI